MKGKTIIPIVKSSNSISMLALLKHKFLLEEKKNKIIFKLEENIKIKKNELK